MDERLNAIERGADAAKRLRDIAPLVTTREEAVLKKLVIAYRQGTLTENGAFSGVAAIAELRALRDDLSRDVQRGAQAREELTTGRSG